jgi:hypothetical protein
VARDPRKVARQTLQEKENELENSLGDQRKGISVVQLNFPLHL